MIYDELAASGLVDTPAAHLLRPVRPRRLGSINLLLCWELEVKADVNGGSEASARCRDQPVRLPQASQISPCKHDLASIALTPLGATHP